ncbi:MAG: dynamin family protein [Chromatiaceae bacterium]|nr:dynamin family protein [Chromatiaceae bacterium]
MSNIGPSLSVFRERRDSLSNAIAQLKTLVERHFDGLHVNQLDSLAQQVLNDLKFHVLCVGDFSSGKTTFINKFLLQGDILPARARPTTTRLTTIRFGSTLRATLLKRDGTAEIIDEDVKQRIDNAVAADGSEIEGVDRVLIEVPSPVLSEGLEVVDSPGLNDPDILRMKVTLDYLHQADAILYFLNAQQAWTRYQKEFIEETILAREDLDKLFLLLNYWDLIEQSERDDLLEYVGEELDRSLAILRDKLDPEVKLARPDLIPVSAKTGENQALVQERIWDYLASKKGQDVLSYKIQRFNTYVDQYLDVIEERAEILNEDLKSRQERRQQLAAEVEEYRLAREDFVARLKRHLRPEIETLRDQISIIFDQNIGLLQTELENLRFERNDDALVKRRLSAKLSYFQRRLVQELTQIEASFLNSIRARIEEQKGLLRIPSRKTLDWQDYFTDLGRNDVGNDLTMIQTGQVASAGLGLAGLATFIGASAHTAAISGASWSFGLGTLITGGAPTAILTVGVPALAIAAVGAGIYLALRQYSSSKTSGAIGEVEEDVIAKIQLSKMDVLSKLESNQEIRLDEICQNVDCEVQSFYEQKRQELEKLMSLTGQESDVVAVKRALVGLKLAVNP